MKWYLNKWQLKIFVLTIIFICSNYRKLGKYINMMKISFSNYHLNIAKKVKMI